MINLPLTTALEVKIDRSDGLSTAQRGFSKNRTGKAFFLDLETGISMIETVETLEAMQRLNGGWLSGDLFAGNRIKRRRPPVRETAARIFVFQVRYQW